jgi:hypothetical protein
MDRMNYSWKTLFSGSACLQLTPLNQFSPKAKLNRIQSQDFLAQSHTPLQLVTLPLIFLSLPLVTSIFNFNLLLFALPFTLYFT